MKLAYAGSFDPFTNGHLHIVRKASLLKDVEKVVIIVSNNKGKKHHFSSEKRVEMISKSLSEFGDNTLYEVVILPQNEYAVSFARSIGCDVMLRGVRTEPDFQDECRIYQANKKIDGKMETIYMMPDINLSEVRSSLIMGLVGPSEWMFVVKQMVPWPVMNALCQKFSMELCGINEIYGAEWKAYENNPYHNWEHIAYFLSEFVKYAGEGHRLEMLGILCHDLLPFSDIGDFALKCFFPGSNEFMLKKEAYEVIMSTNHENLPDFSKDTTGLCKLAHDIDLSVLSWPSDRYRSYANAVRDEYVRVKKIPEEVYINGRISFLNTMLNKPRIYLLGLYKEETARSNMNEELFVLYEEKGV